MRPLAPLIPHPALQVVEQPVLADGCVCYVGQPIAVAVAESQYLAEDLRDAVEVEYDPLPVVASAADSYTRGAPTIHAAAPRNLAGRLHLCYGDISQAFAVAAHRLSATIEIGWNAALPLEGRGVLASWDAPANTLTVWTSTQHAHTVRRVIGECLSIPQAQVRVIAPAVGGGFGSKMLVYPEEVVIPCLAIALNRPVKWVEDRKEHLAVTGHERRQSHEIELAVDRHGRILGVRDRFLHDCGAYAPYGLVVPQVTASMIPGPYRVPACETEAICVYTNTAPMAVYRGAGRPQAVFVMTRVLDMAAHALRIAPPEMQRRNLIRSEELPYEVGLRNQYQSAVVYDSGDYPAMFETAATAIRNAAARYIAEGRRVGVGISAFVEGTAGGPYEGAIVSLDERGHAVVSTGATPNGQGHATILKQLCADALGLNEEAIDVYTGDTARIPYGIGSYGSRTAVLAGNSVHQAAMQVRHAAVQLAARLLEARPEDLAVERGRVFVRGAPQVGLTYSELSRAANPLRGRLPDLAQPGLRAEVYFQPTDVTYSAGVHAAVVDVDRETGFVHILHYIVVHDSGRMIHPLIVEGQIHGGVAQGIGSTLLEEIVYDRAGQLLTASLLDYIAPTPLEVPSLEVYHHSVPSPRNPLGVKGAGEGGVIPVGAVLAQAIEDALQLDRAVLLRLPITPEHVMRLGDGIVPPSDET